MAKISARGAHALVSVNAEKTNYEGGITRERFVVRSDGYVLSRIVWSTYPGKNYYGKGGRLDHNSGFSKATLRKRNAEGVVQLHYWKLLPAFRTPNLALDHVTRVLEKRGMTIVSHDFR